MAKKQGILDALTDYYEGFTSIPSAVSDYVSSTNPDKALSDAKKYASNSADALANQFKEDPFNILLDMAPVVGEVRAFLDAEDLRGMANQTEASGDIQKADSLRREASMTMAGAIPLLGMVARAGKKIGTAGRQMTNDGKPIMRSQRIPEESIAVPDQDMMLAKRLIDGGFLTLESATKPVQVKKAINKYRKNMKESSAFADREMRAAENDYQTIFTPTDIGERTIINPETLLGKVAVPIQGDLSNLGILDRIGGLDVGTQVQAGNKYSQQGQGSGFGWQSMLDTAQTVQNKVRSVAEATDQAPIGVYTTMGLPATNFSTAIAEPMMKQVLASTKLTKADKQVFDKELQSKTVIKKKKDGTKVTTYPFADWVGLDHPDAMNQLMGRGKYENIGKKRTLFTEVMGKDEYRKKGFPVYQELLDATQDPDTLSAPMKGSGLSMYQTQIGDAVFDPTTHMSYSGKMPGDYIGGLGGSIPFEIMFPDAFAEQMKRKNKSGNPFTPPQAIDAVMKKPEGYQLYDERTVQGIIDYIGKVGLK
tara:strand:+ start:1430 stop:3034 length:1605 start_codon:yes stop_codon:yes gene_type:complete